MRPEMLLCKVPVAPAAFVFPSLFFGRNAAPLDYYFK
jgi:hypothetical protein